MTAQGVTTVARRRAPGRTLGPTPRGTPGRAPRVSRAYVAVLLPLLWLGVGACDDTGDGDPVAVDAAGKVKGQLFLDLNGTGQADGGDEGAEGFTVRLEQPAGGREASATTDTAGRFSFSDVPVGRWVIRLDENQLGDSLDAFGAGFEDFELPFADSVALLPGLTYKTFTLDEVRALDPGLPLFSHGIALNALGSGVRSLHVRSGDTYLRVTGILGGFAQPGDSVRVRGRSAREAGQPLLTSGAVFGLETTSIFPEPIALSTSQAASADGGLLDAALVSVSDAEILEVELLDDDDVRVLIDDGSGELELRYQARLNVNHNTLVPDTVFVDLARGLLVPYVDGGETRWRLEPRARSDVRTEEREFPEPVVAAMAVPKRSSVSNRYNCCGAATTLGATCGTTTTDVNSYTEACYRYLMLSGMRGPALANN